MCAATVAIDAGDGTGHAAVERMRAATVGTAGGDVTGNAAVERESPNVIMVRAIQHAHSSSAFSAGYHAHAAQTLPRERALLKYN